eukprot:symbB.v1.2.006852.t1/scaffold408.1/size210514/10
MLNSPRCLVLDFMLYGSSEESHMLLRTTAVRCMLMLSPAVAECKVHGEWPTKVSGSPDSPTLGYPSRPRQSTRPTVGGGRHSIAEFFRRSSSLEPDQPPLPLKAPRRSCCSSSAALEGGQDVIYNFFSPEVFEELGDSGVSPEEVLQSLGHCAPEYRTMSTNSKSGELLAYAEVQREFCAQHELDAQLLESFKMMDYSVLIGVHFVEDEFQRMLEPGWGDGCLISEDCKEVYYIGIIDHSIKYGIKKQAENLLRVAQGTSDRASCVSADTYAERQLMFLYQKVMNNPSAMDIGTEGRLRVDLFEATELIAADWNGASDPYVTLKLGLCVKHTATVPINCNPAHEHQELKITVWDEDHVKSIRGNDDFLGRLSVPLAALAKRCQCLGS